MKRALFSIPCLLTSVTCLLAQPSGPVMKSASGTTTAAVYFEPGVRPAPVAAVDVTSDKAASVLSFQAGTAGRFSAVFAAASATNAAHITGYPTMVSNTLLLAVSGSSVFPLVVTNVAGITNTTLTLENPLGTNVAIGDTIREVTTSYATVTSDVTATNALNLSATNGFVANAVILIRLLNNTYTTNTVATVVSNLITTTTTNAESIYVGSRVYLLTTNLYAASIAAAASSTALTIVTNIGPGLTNGDSILISPATGGHIVRQVGTYTSYLYQRVIFTAALGTALAAGDTVYQVGQTNTAPVGAATLRLSPTAWAIPQAVPARVVLDGTSACSINSVLVNYGN